MDTPLFEDLPRPPARGFSALHRDVWRAVRTAPIVFLVLPAIVWFPVDLVLETIVSNAQLDFWREMRLYTQYGRLAQWIVGTLVIAVQMRALQIMAKGERVRFGDALQGGLEMWSRMMGVFFSATWRTSLALLLLIVPGLYLMVRYSLAMPVAAFEEKRGNSALEASGRYVKGSGWRILFLALGAMALYAPLIMMSFALLPGMAGPWLNALACIPANVLGSLMIVGLGLVYVD